MSKKAQTSAIILLLVIAGIVIAGIFAWNYNWLNLRFKFENANADGAVNPANECPETSADMGTPCCKRLESGELQPSVSLVYTRTPCGCPSDTSPKGYAPEGKNYLLCDCNDCLE